MGKLTSHCLAGMVSTVTEPRGRWHCYKSLCHMAVYAMRLPGTLTPVHSAHSWWRAVQVGMYRLYTSRTWPAPLCPCTSPQRMAWVRLSLLRTEFPAGRWYNHPLTSRSHFRISLQDTELAPGSPEGSRTQSVSKHT